MPDQPPILNEATAQKKILLPSCGGEARWDPAKPSLVCPFCGTVAPGKLEQTPGARHIITSTIQSRRYAAFLTVHVAGQAKKVSVKCQIARQSPCSTNTRSANAAIFAVLRTRSL